MTANELITIFRGSQQYVPLSGLTELSLLQYTLDKIWAVDADVRIVDPPPYVTTAAGTTVYTFDNLIPSVSNVRRFRGIFDPSLTATNINDYNYLKTAPGFDQNLLKRRLYYKGVVFNAETRTVTFLEDPGTTTTTWKADFYPTAPIMANDTRVPVLPGWELDLVYTGMMAWFEESKATTSEYWVPLFEAQKTRYYAALNRERELQGVDQNDYHVLQPHVSPI